MKGKIGLMVMLAGLLAFGMTVIGCDDGYTTTTTKPSTGGGGGGDYYYDDDYNTGGGNNSGTTNSTITSGTYVCTYLGSSYRLTLSSYGSTSGSITFISAPSGHLAVAVYSYTISGSEMTLKRGTTSGYYTITSSTSFNGYGEYWSKLAN